jgi:hypothetical protein
MPYDYSTELADAGWYDDYSLDEAEDVAEVSERVIFETFPHLAPPEARDEQILQETLDDAIDLFESGTDY